MYVPYRHSIGYVERKDSWDIIDAVTPLNLFRMEWPRGNPA